MQHLYLGIDWGKKFSQLFAFGEDGVIVLDARVASLDLRQWRAVLTKLGSYRVHAAFEIGPQYDWLYDLLTEYCAEVVVVDPAQFALICKSQRKTDKIDAQKLAEGVRRGDLPAVHVPDKQTRADRRLVAFVHWHSQRAASVKGKIRSLLLMHRLDCPYSNITGVGALAWLGEQALPQMDGQSQLFLKLLLDDLQLLRTQRAQLDAVVKTRAQTYAQAPVLDSIPGFGALAILAVLSAIGKIGRFERKEQLSSYFGTCGSVYQSGQTLRLGSLTKRGNVHVRWLLSQALQHLHRKDAKVRKRYERLRRKKSAGVARGAQVRWLTEIIWRLLRSNETYQLNRKRQAA